MDSRVQTRRPELCAGIACRDAVAVQSPPLSGNTKSLRARPWRTAHRGRSALTARLMSPICSHPIRPANLQPRPCPLRPPLDHPTRRAALPGPLLAPRRPAERRRRRRGRASSPTSCASANSARGRRPALAGRSPRPFLIAGEAIEHVADFEIVRDGAVTRPMSDRGRYAPPAARRRCSTEPPRPATAAFFRSRPRTRSPPSRASRRCGWSWPAAARRSAPATACASCTTSTGWDRRVSSNTPARSRTAARRRRRRPGARRRRPDRGRHQPPDPPRIRAAPPQAALFGPVRVLGGSPLRDMGAPTARLAGCRCGLYPDRD